MATTNGLDGLTSLAARLDGVSTTSLVAADPGRATGFAVRAGSVYANFARQRYDREALEALFALAESVDAPGRLCPACWPGGDLNLSLTCALSVSNTARQMLMPVSW